MSDAPPPPRRDVLLAPPSWDARVDGAVLAALVSAYLLLQWAVLPEIHWGDTLRVFRYAAAWPDVPTDHHAMRVGLVWPTRLSQTVFGYGQGAFYVVSFAFGVTLTIGTYLTGRQLFGRLVGGLVTVALLSTPYVVESERFLISGLILPDLPAAAAFTLGVGLLLVGLDSEPGRRQRWAFLIAGASLGSAYLIREFTPAMYVVVPVAFALWRVPLRRMVWVVAPMLGVLSIELATNAVVHGDPLARLRVSSEHGRVLGDPQTANETIAMWVRAFTDGSRGQFLFACLGLNVAGAITFRDRRLLLTLVWFTSMLAALLALGGLLDPASPALRIALTRYWFPTFPALLLGGLGTAAMAVAAARRRHRGVGTAAGAVLAVWLVASLLVPAASQVRAADRDDAWVELRSWLATEGQGIDRIATDSRSDLMLDVYRHEPWGGDLVWDGQIVEFDHGLDQAPITDLGRTPILYAPQGPTQAPPPTAAELFRSSDGSLVLVAP